ncbi:hypothetical protein HPB52_013045 [Rhipicephalus sanguineus]|uniref:Uncharacterized protein n=1 Tax=Rhipicephalus sanguineus TaxID=34632 RepID=A0A9D4PFF3_RHISA|nr:hypothetical protein HPB52_013045 [Rhipicephalus sanguineus]
MTLYRSYRQGIERERFYDNTWGSSLLAETCGGVLRTRPLQNKYAPSASTTCHRCSVAAETIQHVVLESNGLRPGPNEPPLEQTDFSALATGHLTGKRLK